MGFGPIDNRVNTLNTQNYENKVPSSSPQKDEESTSLAEKIGVFFKRVIGGRIGAKVGHHSALGRLIKVGLQEVAGLKKVVKKQIAPTHTYTFNELGKERAQYLKPWVTAAKIANAMDFPDSYKKADNNFGILLRDLKGEYLVQFDKKQNLHLSSISPEMVKSMSKGEERLLNDIQSMCSEDAYISPTGAVVDPDSGLRAAIVKDPNHHDRYIVSFGSTGSAEKTDDGDRLAKSQGKVNLLQGLGLEPKAYRQARELIGSVITLCGEENVSTAGHSLGGGLAQYSALYNGVKGRCFNASPLGVGLQQILGHKIDEAGDLIDHVSMRGDWLSHSGALMPIGIHDHKGTIGPDTRPRILSHIADFLGIRTRGNFGKKYYINFNKETYAQHIRNQVEKKGGKNSDLLAVGRGKKKEIIEKSMYVYGKVKKTGEKTDTRHCSILTQLDAFAKPGKESPLSQVEKPAMKLIKEIDNSYGKKKIDRETSVFTLLQTEKKDLKTLSNYMREAGYQVNKFSGGNSINELTRSAQNGTWEKIGTGANGILELKDKNGKGIAIAKPLSTCIISGNMIQDSFLMPLKEATASAIDKKIGFNFVPDTVLVNVKDHGICSVSKFVKFKSYPSYSTFSDGEIKIKKNRYVEAAVLDFILCSQDAHMGNIGIRKTGRKNHDLVFFDNGQSQPIVENQGKFKIGIKNFDKENNQIKSPFSFTLTNQDFKIGKDIKSTVKKNLTDDFIHQLPLSESAKNLIKKQRDFIINDADIIKDLMDNWDKNAEYESYKYT